MKSEPAEDVDREDIPSYTGCVWEQPPDDWYVREFSFRHMYGGEVYGKHAVYMAFKPEHAQSPLLGNGLGEWRVYAGFDSPELVARFPHYPNQISEEPDLSSERGARYRAEGYGFRLAAERDADD